MIKLAITDDHPLLVSGVRNLLSEEKDIELIASFKNGKQTIDEIHNYHPDILLLDINLPDTDGIEVCKNLVKAYDNLKIIGLTSYKEVSFLKSLLKSGAKGYLLKNAPAVEIIDAVKKVYAGEEYVDQEMKELLLAETVRKASNIGFIPKLTRREKEILTLISEEYTTQEIADKLFLSPKTVETHRQNLILKLGVKNSVGLVRAAIEKGLI